MTLGDNVVAERHSEAGALPRWLGGEKRLEYFLLHSFCHLSPVVGYLYYGITAQFSTSCALTLMVGW
jgi:hypothetical protein